MHMRTILLIQTLIIVAGGYYIYRISHEATPAEVVPVVATTTVSVSKVTPPKAADIVASSTTEVGTSSTVQTNPTGPHDAGMEWPTLDGPQVQ
jgi:hypothetical protein